MKSLSRFTATVLIGSLMGAFFLLTPLAHAQDAAGGTVAAPVDLPAADFASQVLQAVHDFGGLPTLLKIAAVITLLVSSMKVSALRTLLWDKLGPAKAWLAPLLGLAAGLLSQGTNLNLASVVAYLSAGAGAIVLHELLELLKSIPGIGPLWVSLITVIEGALGGGSGK